MRDHQLFRIEIYHNGVVFAHRVRGKKKYLMFKAFLDELEGRHYRADALPRPIPNSGGDFYVLNDEQLAALSAFRRNASRIERGFPATSRPPRRW
jgi:hypothetical protein